MDRTRRYSCAVVLALLVFGCGGSAPGTDDVAASMGFRPNVIVIVVDDWRWDEFGAAGHSYLETPNIDRLAAEGAMFVNSFHAVPLCSPNRASILTGQYPSRHGIIDNVARNRASHQLDLFPAALHADGYETAFVGKWHMGNDPTPRPGFDYWSALPGQGRTIDPLLWENGGIVEEQGYVTDVLTDRAIAFMERDRSGPFFLYIGHKAIHPDARQLDDGSVDLSYPRGYIPAPRHLGRYEQEIFPRRENVVSSPSALGDKPALRRALEYRATPEITEEFATILDPGTSEETIRRRAEMLLAVDENLGRMMAVLERDGILDSTMIIFTSDNGFFYGEHGLSLERRMPYEEAIRNPLLVRFPALAQAGSVIDGLVSSVDIAATVLDVTGTTGGEYVQGQSVRPLLEGRTDGWRSSLLVEFYTYENPMPWLTDMDYRAVRTERYKYIHWIHHPDEPELYDLESDPYETVNIVNDPNMAGVVADLRHELQRLVLEAMGLGNSE